MSDQPRRRFRPRPTPRRAGEPNVLSNQATPNRLSTMGSGGPPASPTTASNRASAPPTLARPRTPGRPTPERSDEPATRRLRLPSLGTVITIGFVLFWVARFLGNAGLSLPGSTPKPIPATATPRPAPTAAIGAVTFGRSLGEECALEQPGRAFAPDVVVWWRADMAQAQAADAAIVVVTFKGSNQIDYEYVPPDPSVGEWQVFCSGPVTGADAGVYRVEIWNGVRSKLLARGEFTRIGPRATPTAAATQDGAGSSRPGSPEPTLVVARAGAVTFGTEVGSGCTLSGVDETFDQRDLVWWRAELNQALPPGATARLFTLLNGTIITDGPVPADALIESRKVVCAWAHTEGVATGYYVVQVWSSDRQIMLATGTFFRRP